MSFVADAITAIVLAAGAGSRLGELGRTYSKPTVPLAGRVLIDWVVDELHAAGVAHVVVVGHPGDGRLADWQRLHRSGVTLVLQPERRGIADALVHALSSLGDAPAYLACACDSLYRPHDVAAFVQHARRRRDAVLLGVLEMGTTATTARSAVVLSGERVTRIIEKPAEGTAPSGVVGLPLYWLPRSVDPYLRSAPGPGNDAYVTTALNAFIREGGAVHAHHMGERIEVTTSEDLSRADAWLRRQWSALT